MLSPPPAIRALLIGLILVTLVVLGGAGLHLQSLERQAEQHLASELKARSASLAAALAAPDSAERIQETFGPIAEAEWPVTLGLVDRRGRVVASSDSDLTDGVGWGGMIEDGTSAGEVFRGREGYIVALHPVGRAGYYVASMAPSSVAANTTDAVWNVAVWAAALWGLLLGCMAMMAWYAGPYTTSKLERLGARIALGEADPSVLMRHARLSLGGMADVFAPIAQKMTAAWASVGQSRDHVRALYQVNPHYVLLCTLDGRIIEANPAFYAVTGLSLEALKAGPVEVLDDIFPIGPLQDMAARSLKEACSIGGIEYGIIGQDDEPRAVTVSLRAFPLDGEDVVIIQATDVSARRTMEQRIHAFNDTLDLMVDQRVAQLTAGQKSIRRVLDGAGLVLASFDAGGATRRWSGGARALTGRTVGHVPHFSSVTSALEMTEAERSAFTAWFWGSETHPFVARHAIADSEGGVRTRRFVWRKSTAPDRGDLRTIVALELPADPSDPQPRAASSTASPVRKTKSEDGGDGRMGHAPLPDSAFGRIPDA
ncbi:MAG: PAS domain-containing protein [Bacteroidota bacterium]